MSLFAMTSWFRRSTFRREIAYILVFKFLLLSLIWYYGFHDHAKHATGAPQIQQRLLGNYSNG